MFKKPTRLLLILIATTSFSAFAQNVAVVGKKAIPSSREELMVKQYVTQGQKDTPELRKAIREELITREVLVQEADKQGFGDTPEIKERLENARQSLAITNLFSSYLKKHPVTEAEIKAEYDRYRAQVSDKEYRARHILVEKEEDAKAIIVKLKNGEKFEDLAKQQSKDPGSAVNGGDLNWAQPGGYVKPFADALLSMKKDQLLDVPVKTQFGYHVIRLDDVRAAKIPTLEEVKPQIVDVLSQKKLLPYQEEIRKKAKVK